MNLQYVDCPTNHIDFEDIKGIEAYRNYLIVNQRLKLTIWDMSDPTDIKLINEMPYQRPAWAMKLIADQLIIWGSATSKDNETMIFVFDISDPRNIKQENGYKLDIGIVKIVKSRGRLLAISSVGVYDFQADKILCKAADIDGFMLNSYLKENNNRFDTAQWTSGYGYDSYPEDWIACDDFMIFSGCHRGVRIFRIQPDGTLTLAKYIETQFYMADGLHWDVPGKSFIICGGDQIVLKFDMSIPEKTKRVKGAKLTDIELCKQHIREGDTLLVFGLKVSGDKPYVCEVSVAADIPEVISKYEIKGYNPKSTGSDGAQGIVKSGYFLILCTYHKQLGVVKIS
jgi:hypothetical protein